MNVNIQEEELLELTQIQKSFLSKKETVIKIVSKLGLAYNNTNNDR